MVSFFVCLAILIVGYFTYGKYVDMVFGPDDRITPAVALKDDVDYLVMPQWRIFLIQLLNIAGLGPIWGAVGGALWGPKVFLWITFGSVFAGGVHDFASGFISMRHNGLSVAEITGTYMGDTMKSVMRVFSVVLLFMVGVVFAKGPASLLAYLIDPNGDSSVPFANVSVWLIIIMIYYFVATFLSVDKIIGRIYPVFGICLIIMAAGVGIGIFTHGYANDIPEVWTVLNTNMNPTGTGAWPMMFISVACGAISGFHSTQSPIMSRCCQSERQAHQIFYGAMICEGIIALIWAAAACALFPIEGGLMTGLHEAMAAGQAACVYNICSATMGKAGVVLAMIGVIACPITSGDTAFRSARLSLADWFHLDQKDRKKRLALAVPLLTLGYLVCQLDYTTIWNYFASTNQILAMIVLWTAAIYLVKNQKAPWIAVIPAVFMSVVTMTCVFSSRLYLGGIFGSAAPMAGRIAGAVCGILFLTLFLINSKKIRSYN